MDIKEVLLPWFTNFFDKKSAVRGIRNEITQNEQLAEELHKQLLKNLKKE